MTFIRTSAQTRGKYVLIGLRADPDAFVAAAHVHPAQTETFKVVSGTLGARVAGTRIEAHVGDRLVVEPGRRTSGGTREGTSWSSAARFGPRCSSSR